MGVAGPHEHHWFAEPTEKVSNKYIIGLVVAQLIFFIALLGPAVIGIGVKVQSIVPDDQKTSALGIVAGVGALFAVIGNVLFGRFSDRTTSRWGRRRPWIVAGTVVMTNAFLIMALSQTVPVLAAGWCLAQLGADATLARSSPRPQTRYPSSSAAACLLCSASRRTSASSAAPTWRKSSPTRW